MTTPDLHWQMHADWERYQEGIAETTFDETAAIYRAFVAGWMAHARFVQDEREQRA